MSSGSYWGRQVLKEERDKRGNKCNRCPNSENLEFHHIEPTDLKGIGRGLNKRAADIRNNPDKYELLCRSCHIEAHPNGFGIHG